MVELWAVTRECQDRTARAESGLKEAVSNAESRIGTINSSLTVPGDDPSASPHLQLTGAGVHSRQAPGASATASLSPGQGSGRAQGRTQAQITDQR